MEAATPSEPRLRALVEAGIALASELSLDGLLQRLTELAAELTGARYAALGVIDGSGSRLERFVTHGVDDATRAAIGDLPQGRGILGALITDAHPLRLHAIRDDPRSVGFPANHPPMTTFLGVPVLLRGIAYGNLYLTEKEGGGDFSRGRSGAGRAAGLAGGGRDRERAPVRVGDALVAAARVADRGRAARSRARPSSTACSSSSRSGCGNCSTRALVADRAAGGR